MKRTGDCPADRADDRCAEAASKEGWRRRDSARPDVIARGGGHRHRCYDHVTRRTDPAFARPESYATLRMSRFETAAITTAES
jgi:hypothetical protein